MTLWYLARASGLVLLAVLTANLVLGIAIQGAWHPGAWPRFAVQAVHRNLALLAVALLVIHVVTIELDPFVPVGWWAALVPFVSPYRPLWLGLGTLSLDLMVAVVVTSLLRSHLRLRWWRVIHWLAYLSWPVAVLHSLGTGTDTRLTWVFGFEVGCVGLVAATVLFRVARATWPRVVVRGLLMAAVAATPMAVLAWSAAGPLQSGWARRAGTPTTALASGAPTTSGARGQPSAPAPFTASFLGSATASPSGQGETISISGTVQGGAGGQLMVSLAASQLPGGSLAVDRGTVTYRPATGSEVYSGAVVSVGPGTLIFKLVPRGGVAVPAELTINGPVPASSVSGLLYFGSVSAAPAGGDGGQDS
jgi:sulfoxide reductase heme-binding subunit YedZ